ncbi:MAG TPA: hypothetical protein PLN13_02010 [Bacteroidia bacterium]|nr:hypothetical protein [Bacteroidia bacterium]HRH07329.1 hypothetical protein [Bacteroidia bacterium]
MTTIVIANKQFSIFFKVLFLGIYFCCSTGNAQNTDTYGDFLVRRFIDTNCENNRYYDEARTYLNQQISKDSTDTLSGQLLFILQYNMFTKLAFEEKVDSNSELNTNDNLFGIYEDMLVLFKKYNVKNLLSLPKNSEGK